MKLYLQLKIKKSIKSFSLFKIDFRFKNFFATFFTVSILTSLLATLSLSGNTIVEAGNFLVTNTKLEGKGSIREAIQKANQTPGKDTINFDLDIGSIIDFTQSTEPIYTDFNLNFNGLSVPGNSLIKPSLIFIRPNNLLISQNAQDYSLSFTGIEFRGADFDFKGAKELLFQSCIFDQTNAGQKKLVSSIKAIKVKSFRITSSVFKNALALPQVSMANVENFEFSNNTLEATASSIEIAPGTDARIENNTFMQPRQTLVNRSRTARFTKNNFLAGYQSIIDLGLKEPPKLSYKKINQTQLTLIGQAQIGDRIDIYTSRRSSPELASGIKDTIFWRSFEVQQENFVEIIDLPLEFEYLTDDILYQITDQQTSSKLSLAVVEDLSKGQELSDTGIELNYQLLLITFLIFLAGLGVFRYFLI